MAIGKNIKGITIEFNGDTTKLGKALTEIDNKTKGLDKDLRAVDNALKFNPGNTELLAQKQQLLGQKVEQTKERLNALKEAQAKLDDDPAVDKTSQEYMELRREIVTTESKLQHFIEEGKKVEQMLNPLNQFGEKMKDVGSKVEAAGQAFAPISAAAAGVDVALAGLATKSAMAADDLNTLSTVTGISTEKLQQYALAADLVDVSVETIAKSQIKMKKAMASAADGTGSAAEAWQKLGVSVVDNSGHLRDQDTVFQETIKALGQMSNETERDALAMTIFGKSAAELNPLIEDNGETYKMVAQIFKDNDLEIVDQETLDRANDYNDSIDKIKATATLALQTIGTKLAADLAPVMEKLAEGLEKFFGWLSKLSPETLEVIGVIAGVVAAIAPLLIIGGKLITGIGMLLTFAPAVMTAFSALAGPVGIAIAIIAALIAIGVTLYKNWDTIKKKASEIWNAIKKTVSDKISSIKTAFKTFADAIKTIIPNAWKALKEKTSDAWKKIKESITKPFTEAKEKIKDIIDKIKGFLDFDFELPHIPLPHFYIDPPGWKLGDLLEGVIPGLGIEWYAQGGIFKKPSVVGVGEAGSEGVIPLDPFWKRMDQIVEAVQTGGGTGGDNININVYATPGMDVNQIAAAVEQRLVRLQKQREVAHA